MEENSFIVTKEMCKQIENEMYPLVGDTKLDALAQLNRTACEEFAERLMEYASKQNSPSKAMQKKLKALEDQLKVNEGVRSHMAAELEAAKEELRKERENRDRVIANRVDEAKANAKNALRETMKTAALSPMQEQSLEEHETLMAANAASEKLDMEKYSTRWRVLTWNIAYRHSHSARMVLLARENGSYILTRWDGILSYINLNDAKRSIAPFTHYMTIPKTSLAYLLALHPEETPVEMKTGDTDKCIGCQHHNTNPDNPNECLLPACIKDYESKKSAATSSKSTNNTNL